MPSAIASACPTEARDARRPPKGRRQSSATARVLYMDHTATMGGGEVALLNLVRYLDREQYRPVVLLFSEGTLRRALEEAGVETHRMPLAASVVNTRKDTLGARSLLRLRDVLQTLRCIRQVARFIREHDIDLVHTNSLKADIVGGVAAKLARTPVLWHVRDRIDSDYLPGTVVRVFRWLCRALPDCVVANSTSTLGTIRLPKTKRAATVYSGVVMDGRSTASSSGTWHVVHDGVRQEAFAGIGSSPGGPRVGLVGRISPWKGQHVFLRAAARVRERFPGARFLVIGGALFEERAYEREVRELARTLGLEECVEFTGHRDDVPELVGGLDLLVHASTTGEPFGQVVVEGMAAGKPVVATRGGGVPEIVEDGVTGLLVPMGDAEAMAGAMERLLADPHAALAMGRRGRERVEERFTIQQTARKVERIYESLLARERPGQRPAPGGRLARASEGLRALLWSALSR